MNLNKEDWFYFGRWVQPVLSACFWNNWSNNDTNNTINTHNTHNSSFPFDLKLNGSFVFLDGYSFVKLDDLKKMEQFLFSQENNYELLAALEKWVDDVHDKSREFQLFSDK